MPLGGDAGANIAELTKAHGGEKDWPQERLVAAGIRAAESADRLTVYERRERRKKHQAAQKRAFERMDRKEGDERKGYGGLVTVGL